VKLIAGLLAASDALLADAVGALRERFGPVDACSVPVVWNSSPYYRGEMGDDIRRQFVSFERLTAAGALAGLKRRSGAMEDRWRQGNGRRVNIDPGYIATTKLVLASTKDAAHRVYVGGGIYAEVALEFHNGSFHPRARTYPDYANADAVAFFNRVRSTYLAQLRGLH
jgi:hypothetical protein